MNAVTGARIILSVTVELSRTGVMRFRFCPAIPRMRLTLSMFGLAPEVLVVAARLCGALVMLLHAPAVVPAFLPGFRHTRVAAPASAAARPVGVNGPLSPPKGLGMK